VTNHRSFALPILLSLVLFSPSAARAQRGARVAGHIAPSRGAVPRAASARPMAHSGSNARARADRLVPGFDFTGTPVFFPGGRHNGHFAFERRDRRFRDRDFFPGAYFLWDGWPDYVAPDNTAGYEQPQHVEQPEQAQQAEQSPPDVAAEQPPAPQPEAVPADGLFVPGEDHLTLVLRDGHEIQALAFTRSNDSIVYITSSGLRRTLALSDLDTAATLRVNQEQGTFLQPSSL